MDSGVGANVGGMWRLRVQKAAVLVFRYGGLLLEGTLREPCGGHFAEVEKQCRNIENAIPENWRAIWIVVFKPKTCKAALLCFLTTAKVSTAVGTGG